MGRNGSAEWRAVCCTFCGFCGLGKQPTTTHTPGLNRVGCDDTFRVSPKTFEYTGRLTRLNGNTRVDRNRLMTGVDIFASFTRFPKFNIAASSS